MTDHRVVTREQWLAERLELMNREKAFTQEREALAQARRDLPWVRLEQSWQFESEAGETDLTGLFGTASQLIVYHFMFDTDWEAGCPSCSFWADNYNGYLEHLAARDIAFAVVSKAPMTTLTSYRKRMGWNFNWVSSPENEFGQDFGASFTADQIADGSARYNLGTKPVSMSEHPGLSVFIRDGSEVFHTYSCYARGLDMLNGAYHHMDLVPKGRAEADLPYPMAWVKRRDDYAS